MISTHVPRLRFSLSSFSLPIFFATNFKMSSSVDGAVDSISKTQRNLAAVLLSPSTSLDSKGTGATGSTEEPGTATRSLIASVHGRSSLRGSILSASFHNATTGKTSTQLGGDSDAQGGDERRSGGGEGAGSGASSTGSWSDFAGSVGGEVREDKDATPTRRVKDEESDKDALSVSPLKEDYAMALSILEQSMPVTDEQEEEGLALSVDRDSDHFNRWLVDMIANARGDGSSSVRVAHSLAFVLCRWAGVEVLGVRAERRRRRGVPRDRGRREPDPTRPQPPP